MRIYIVGYMASGKSVVGKDLAERLNYTFVDLDELFEERFRIAILEFFEKYDEAAFRQIESVLLHETSRYQNTVIATGGGTPCYFDNMDFILQQGKSVYLKMSSENLVKRLRVIRKKRPLLKGLKEDDLEQYVKSQLAKREPFYKKALLTVEGPNYNLEEILRSLLTASDVQ